MLLNALLSLFHEGYKLPGYRYAAFVQVLQTGQQLRTGQDGCDNRQQEGRAFRYHHGDVAKGREHKDYAVCTDFAYELVSHGLAFYIAPAVRLPNKLCILPNRPFCLRVHIPPQFR